MAGGGMMQHDRTVADGSSFCLIGVQIAQGYNSSSAASRVCFTVVFLSDFLNRACLDPCLHRSFEKA